MTMTTDDETTTDTVALTADDITALRAADGVSFHVNDGAAYLMAGLNERYSSEPRIYSAKEQRVFPASRDYSTERNRKVMCGLGFRVQNFHPSRPLYDGTVRYACFSYEMFAQSSGEWRTIARAMRPGDQVRLDWMAGNDSPVMNDAGYHRDELRLILAGPDGKNVRTFLVDVYVGPDNTARMVRML